MQLRSPFTTIVLLGLFLILLLFVWRSWDRNRMRPEVRSLPTGDTAHDHNHHPNEAPDLDIDVERVKLALEAQKETCKDVDPVLTYYSQEYKNRWKEVIPDINSVGFTPIAKRCAYPGAPCEWQKRDEI